MQQSGQNPNPTAGTVTRRTPAEWASSWVEKFQVYHQRRFGAPAEVTAAQVADFLRFIAARWGAPDWQQAQARQALDAWLMARSRPEERPVAETEKPGAAEKATERATLQATPPVTPAEAGISNTPVGGTGKMTLPQALLRLQGAIRLKHYSGRTEETYGHWLRHYWGFLQRRKGQAGFAEASAAVKVKAFLEHLAVDRQVSAATQNQALNALGTGS